MTIDYDHARNLATVKGAGEALSTILGSQLPRSLLDVGCGTGTWLRAAIDSGINDVFGIDGVAVAPELLHVPKSKIGCVDLSKPFDLGRHFDLVLCLEVAEHLPESSSNALISSIVAHSNSILFSAACPDQPGQHHVNCQWPIYWQSLLNSHGFACDDSIRWQIWNNTQIEPWYRQNIFWARRDPENAGREPRIKAVIHPEIGEMIAERISLKQVHRIEEGRMPVIWYVSTPPRAALAKLLRWISGGSTKATSGRSSG